MKTEPYLTVPQISKRQEMSARNVRKILQGLDEFGNESMIHKDHNGNWQILQSLERYFKRKRAKGKRNFYALSFDIPNRMEVEKIHSVIQYAIGLLEDPTAEIHYVVEMKKRKIEPHVHTYYRCKSRKAMKQVINLAFGGTSYYHSKVFDLEGWKRYITKDGLTITTIKNTEE